MTDIAAAAFVTTRTVQLAFRRYLGCTPMDYLRRVRLDHAHRQLLAADPTRQTVTAVAYRWGFSSASRFTIYYPPGLRSPAQSHPAPLTRPALPRERRPGVSALR